MPIVKKPLFTEQRWRIELMAMLKYALLVSKTTYVRTVIVQISQLLKQRLLRHTTRQFFD